MMHMLLLKNVNFNKVEVLKELANVSRALDELKIYVTTM